MKRLTTRDLLDCVTLKSVFDVQTIDYWDENGDAKSAKAGPAIDRLAAYEDTGMEPEICANYKTFEDEAISKGVTFKRIVELMDADRAGRLVVLDSPRKPLIWGDDEHNSCVCPECGFDLMGIPYGNQMVLQCPECGEYIDAKKCVTYAEAAEAALKAGDNR